MFIDFTQKVLDINGKPMLMPPSPPSTEPTEATLGVLCIQALFGEYRDESITGAEKFARYELATLVNKNLPITVEQVALLKMVVGKGYGAQVVGPIYGLLEEGTATKPKAKSK